MVCGKSHDPPRFDFPSPQNFSDESKNDYLYNVEKCLYRIYGDDCIPYLSDNFKSKNGIEDD